MSDDHEQDFNDFEICPFTGEVKAKSERGPHFPKIQRYEDEIGQQNFLSFSMDDPKDMQAMEAAKQGVKTILSNNGISDRLSEDAVEAITRRVFHETSYLLIRHKKPSVVGAPEQEELRVVGNTANAIVKDYKLRAKRGMGKEGKPIAEQLIELIITLAKDRDPEYNPRSSKLRHILEKGRKLEVHYEKGGI